MNTLENKFIGCGEFEENLSEYLENSLVLNLRKPMSEHALKCPLCHSLMNEVRNAVEVCREIGSPDASMTNLEARILSVTMPESAMKCNEFEEHLTDYLDGFLPARIFHRWERHAALCENCTNLPGAVVRSIAACYTYKVEELPLPSGLNERILQATIGTARAESVKPPWRSQVREWMRGLSVPISVPQMAPVAMMVLFAVLVFSQTGGNSVSGVYQKSFELAGKTYQQGAEIVLRSSAESPASAPQGSNDGSPGSGGSE